MMPPLQPVADIVLAELAVWNRGRRGLPLVVGVCGPQGSGKSTATAQVEAALAARGLTVAGLSLDDLYLGRAARSRLAADVHPLLATRGPPGTHDVACGIELLTRLAAGSPVRLPRFDKGADEPRPCSEWPTLAAGCDVVLFEGWCVGARQQDRRALALPVNALERDEDPGGGWRRFVNDALGTDYQRMFGMIDRLVLLAAPSFEVVLGWRLQQEHELIRRSTPPPPAAMSDADVARFVQHFERITRHVAREMPSRADLTIALDDRRAVVSLQRRP